MIFIWQQVIGDLLVGGRQLPGNSQQLLMDQRFSEVHGVAEPTNAPPPPSPSYYRPEGSLLHIRNLLGWGPGGGRGPAPFPRLEHCRQPPALMLPLHSPGHCSTFLRTVQ